MDSVIEKGRITILDESIAKYIVTARTDALNNIMNFITQFGNAPIVVLVSIVIIVGLYLYNKKRYALTFLIIALADAAFITIVKDIIARERPFIDYALFRERSFSFPSGHALFAICFYGLGLYFFLKLIKNIYLKTILGITGYTFIILIGLSRVYLGVHWTSDVIASFAIGLSWVCITLLFYRVYQVKK